MHRRAGFRAQTELQALSSSCRLVLTEVSSFPSHAAHVSRVSLLTETWSLQQYSSPSFDCSRVSQLSSGLAAALSSPGRHAVATPGAQEKRPRKRAFQQRARLFAPRRRHPADLEAFSRRHLARLARRARPEGIARLAGWHIARSRVRSPARHRPAGSTDARASGGWRPERQTLPAPPLVALQQVAVTERGAPKGQSLLPPFPVSRASDHPVFYCV